MKRLKSESISCHNICREALADADMILRKNKRSLNPSKNFDITLNQQYAVAYHVKGDALYNLGNFEHALLNYHRANKFILKRVIT